ncbi:MAG: type II secretion system protein GspG [Candidatus Eisenbacteria bacterium]
MTTTDRPLPSAARPAGAGFTLVEVILVLIVLGIVSTSAVVSYGSVINRAKNVRAVSDLTAISVAIDDYHKRRGTYPPNLAKIHFDDREDPWGNPYIYLPVDDSCGGTRTDAYGDPVNTDYELYSAGADGETGASLSCGPGADDPIRADNGHFLGIADTFASSGDEETD